MFSTPEQKPIVQRTGSDKTEVLKKNARETKKLTTKLAEIEDKETQWKLNHEIEVRAVKQKLFSSQAHAKNSIALGTLRKVKQSWNERIKEKHITSNDNADEKENKQAPQMKENAKEKPTGDHQTKREKFFSKPKKLPNLEPISKQKNGIALALAKTSKLATLPIVSEPLLNESKSLSQVRSTATPDLFIETIVSNTSESKNNHRNTIEMYLKNDDSPTLKNSSGTKTFSPKLTKRKSQNQRKKNVNPLKNIFQRPTAKKKFLKSSEIKKTTPSEPKTNSEIEQQESNEPLPELNTGNVSSSRKSSFINENFNSPTKNAVPTIGVTSSNLLESVEDYNSDSKISETYSKTNTLSVDNPEFIKDDSKRPSFKNKLSSLRRESCRSTNSATISIQDEAKHTEPASDVVCSYIATYVVEDMCEVLQYKSTSPFLIQSYDNKRKVSANVTIVHEEDECHEWPRRKSLFQEDAFEEIPKVDEENLPPLSSGRYGNFKWCDALHRFSFKRHLKPAALIGKPSVENTEEDKFCQKN